MTELCSTQSVVFIQGFAVSEGGGGGARVLRQLCKGAPRPTHFICIHPAAPATSLENEHHVPIRPSLGRLDRSRFIGHGHRFEPAFALRFRKNLDMMLQDIDHRPCLHLLPHCSADFFHASHLAKAHDWPFVMSIHDDIRYTTRGHPHRNAIEGRLGEVWNSADVRHVICEDIGHEYNRRYGERPFTVVTDSRDVSALPEPSPKPGSFALYFMGLFHNTYYPNLAGLAHALRLLRSRGHHVPPMKMRCGSLTLATPAMLDAVEVLPYVDQAVVDSEMREAAFLYLPLPFGDACENFVRFSFSTKLISYLASGVPILYHGPAESALANYIRRNNAGILVESNDPGEIASALEHAANDETRLLEITRNALDCVRTDFDREKVTRRFWDPILAL